MDGTVRVKGLLDAAARAGRGHVFTQGALYSDLLDAEGLLDAHLVQLLFGVPSLDLF